MTPAAVALTILFVAEQPGVPVVAIELIEQAAVRRATLVLVPDGDRAPALTVASDTAGRVAPTGLPTPPLGASLTPAVDGVIVTFADAGPLVGLVDPPPPQPPQRGRAKAAAPSWPWPPPQVGVADERSLRLFVPAIVDGEATPASLHGVGVRAIGAAVTFTRPLGAVPVAVSIAGAEHDASPPTLVGEATPTSALCAPPTAVVQRLTQVQLTDAACDANGLVVGRLAGVRFGATAPRDQPAKGAVAWRAVTPPGRAP